MAQERFFIGPFKSGLVKDKKPFLIPEEAFAVMRNAYVWRDRVRKRFGSRPMNSSVDPSLQQLFTRLRVKLNGLYTNPATTNAVTGNFTGTVPNAGVPVATPAVGQMFLVTDGTDYEIFTVTALGNPAAMITTGAGAGTFDTTTGALIITGSIKSADVYYYPALPVMGLLTEDTANTNDEEVIGFDTRFAYKFSGLAWERLDPAYNWTGTDYQFFWGANYRGALPQDKYFFVTNFNSTDGMAYLNPASNTFTKFQPYYKNDGGAGSYKVLTARIIIPFYNRLILLNTVEEVSGGTASFQNRARWCQNGNPVDQGTMGVAGTGGWLEPPAIFGRGDHLDAPTSEAIQTALILKDRLIVYFERSTWELVYTGNQVLPFVWQTINIELGAESTFSIIPADTALTGIADVGVHSCNGANVVRIDDNIPDNIFEIQNINNGPDRVYGVRDYASEMYYWAIPVETEGTTKYPNRVLVYNYRNGAWAYNDDSITCFGQYQLDNTESWSSTYDTWDDADYAWNAGTLQNLSRNVIAGNQEGFTFLIDPPLRQTPTNAYALSITNITAANLTATLTIINHNLSDGDYIGIANVLSANDPNNTYQQLNNNIFAVSYVDVNTVTVAINSTTIFDPMASYIGGGTVRLASLIQLLGKQYNFYLNTGQSFTVNKIDFLVDRTSSGACTVFSYAGTGNIITSADTLTTYPYDPTYYPMEQNQDSLWHSIYPNSFGAFLQFEITLTPEQMLNPAISDEDFVLNGMFIYADATASRLQ